MKAVWFWRKNIYIYFFGEKIFKYVYVYIKQLYRIESRHRSHIYSQLIFHKNIMAIQLRKDFFLKKDTETIEYPYGKREQSHLPPDTKITSKWIRDLNVKA